MRCVSGHKPLQRAAGLRSPFALSQAFDVIADRSKGVVDLLWRQVDCSKRKYSVTSY